MEDKGQVRILHKFFPCLVRVLVKYISQDGKINPLKERLVFLVSVGMEENGKWALKPIPLLRSHVLVHISKYRLTVLLEEFTHGLLSLLLVVLLLMPLLVHLRESLFIIGTHRSEDGSPALECGAWLIAIIVASLAWSRRLLFWLCVHQLIWGRVSMLYLHFIWWELNLGWVINFLRGFISDVNLIPACLDWELVESFYIGCLVLMRMLGHWLGDNKWFWLWVSHEVLLRLLVHILVDHLLIEMWVKNIGWLSVLFRCQNGWPTVESIQSGQCGCWLWFCFRICIMCITLLLKT